MSSPIEFADLHCCCNNTNSMEPIGMHNDNQAGRIAHVDGLRGVAIGMVLFWHVSGRFDFAWLRIDHMRFTPLFLHGYEGVDLFLVLSGFCLAQPALYRRARGDLDWFRPSVFFARRIVRILPSYYVALAASVGLALLVSHLHRPQLAQLFPVPHLADVIVHVLLLQNNTRYALTINSPFWSLGLEWQWYWVFPLLLAGLLRWPRLIVSGCAILGMVWTFLSLSGVMLPTHVFEFSCGIAAAYAMAYDRVPTQRVLVTLFVGSLLLLALAPLPYIHPQDRASLIWRLTHPVEILGLAQSLLGVTAAALILLGVRIHVVSLVLSWRPLVFLGLISYSVYLIHIPLLQLTLTLAPHELPMAVRVIAAIVIALVVSAFFHRIVESPCARLSSTQGPASPITRIFSWADALWAWGSLHGRRQHRITP